MSELSAPYVRSRVTTGDLMYLVVLALLPCAGVGIYHYGFHAALLLGISVLTAILSELVCDLVRKGFHPADRRSRPETAASSVLDYSCVVTGLIGGLILPPAAPFWTAVVLPVLAIVVFKHLFGGIGRNLFNPAMAAKCVLLLAARQMMLNVSTWEYAESSPLVLLAGGETPDLLTEITGRTAGYIGTSSAAAVLCAAAILYLGGLIDLVIPVSSIAAFAGLYVIFGRYGLSAYTLGVQLCGGSFLFTVFIMAEDFTTTPISRRARCLYGILLGALTFLFRRLGFLEDACVYALLLVNALRPLLDRRLPQAYFGVNSNKWIIKETASRRRAREERERLENQRTNEQLDAEFAAFEQKIERETRGLETARYTGDTTLLRAAMAETPGQMPKPNGEQGSPGQSRGMQENVSKSGQRPAAGKRPGRHGNPSPMSEHEKRVSREREKRKETRNRRDAPRDLSLEEAKKVIQDAVARERYADRDDLSDLQITSFENKSGKDRGGTSDSSGSGVHR